MKKFGKILGGIILGIVLILLVAVAILTALEYRPDQIETLNTTSGKQSISTGDSMTILTYNTGYAGLSKDEDFFMDGGSKVMPETKDLVKHNMKGIAGILNDADADVCFLQEVDIDSKRSYHINEKAYYEKALGVDGIFACNFKCVYVPYPLPTIGKVESGLVTYSDYKVSETSRIALPEAYDSGEGKIAQRKVLVKKLKEEYEKGNYVIAGGDFNQTFDGMDTYPIHDKDSWVPGKVGKEDIPEGFSYAVSDNVPTCRLLNGPYSGNYDDSQVYVLDGFIVSDNLKIDQVENIDTQFEYTDHQPVKLNVTLK